MATRTRNVGAGQISKLRTQLASAQRRTQVVRAKAGEFVEAAVRTAEVGGVAFILGYFQGKKGGWEVMGVPVELGLGLGAHVVALMGIGGKAEEHLRAVGDGGLAAYLTTYGRGMGREAAAKAAAGVAAPPLAVPTSGYQVGAIPGAGEHSVPLWDARTQGESPPGMVSLEELAALSNAL